MSIAAANLFTRNIYREFVEPGASPQRQAAIAKLVSLIVKLGALGFILFLPTQFAINLQLLGGVWILQTFPTIVVGLYGRGLNAWALLLGWAAGMGCGTAMVMSSGLKSAVYTVHLGAYSLSAYAALFALATNFTVALAASVAVGIRGDGVDHTRPDDYHEDIVTQT
jgi:SSS family solute:Na+ symporter